LTELERAIRSSWSAETSDHPTKWQPDNPARGQCGATAHVLRALLGGHVVIARIGETDPQEHHAWNRFASGLELDLTHDQFTETPDLTECVIPEPMLLELFGAQAELLLARVRAVLAEAAAV
jgi:hypothetical protein